VAGGVAFDGADPGQDTIGEDLGGIFGKILAKLNVVKAYAKTICDDYAINPAMQGLFTDHDFHEGQHHNDAEGEQESDQGGTDENHD